MRIAAQCLFGPQAYCLQRLFDHAARLALIGFGKEFTNWGGQRVVNLIERVVNLERILENGLHLAAEGAPPLAVHPMEILPFVEDLAAGWRGHAQKQAGERRLATATLAGNGNNSWSGIINDQRCRT